MTTTSLFRIAALALTTLAALTGTAVAERLISPITTAPSGPLRLDIEIDPAAYLMSGYSVHAGVGRGGQRVDLGVYAMDVPELLHGNEGWAMSFAGAGVKVQNFLLDDQRGFFVDLGIGASLRELQLADSGVRRRDIVVSLGASAGYRILLPYGLYVTPWAGINYDFDAADIMLAGRSFDSSPATPFAAVHIGYRVPLSITW